MTSSSLSQNHQHPLLAASLEMKIKFNGNYFFYFFLSDKIYAVWHINDGWWYILKRKICRDESYILAVIGRGADTHPSKISTLNILDYRTKEHIGTYLAKVLYITFCVVCNCMSEWKLILFLITAMFVIFLKSILLFWINIQLFGMLLIKINASNFLIDRYWGWGDSSLMTCKWWELPPSPNLNRLRMSRSVRAECRGTYFIFMIDWCRKKKTEKEFYSH